MAGTLDDDAITARLKELPDWSRSGEEIRRELTAPSFLAGIDLVVEVARAAEEADHHPDIDVRWRTVTFALSTHSAGGLTTKDFDLARRIDRIAAEHAAQ
ncbi:4a-hydroxytetrahydrobiopterin dehydratase [Actinomadura fulvescens]|uniref:Putative pterin-4-alpha-carbinolamine dehydratase n=1 Tax=Actinomadura fulvescens TaxID=46160 RepID=A0ABN3PRV9_9ACTN